MIGGSMSGERPTLADYPSGMIDDGINVSYSEYLKTVMPEGYVAEDDAMPRVSRGEAQRIAAQVMNRTIAAMGAVEAFLDSEEIDSDEDWRDQSICAQIGGELFFAEQGGSTRDAKKICGQCAVRSECLVYALENGERYGIWGGLTERQRRALVQR
jgi:WhiB family transcriptional regulator, redox-sensing transcriptional regulator